MRRASGKRSRASYKSIEGPAWDFIDKHCPGAHGAWKRDVGLPDHEFTIGVTGRPMRAVAWSKDWTALPELLRKHFTYNGTDRAWRSSK